MILEKGSVFKISFLVFTWRAVIASVNDKQVLGLCGEIINCQKLLLELIVAPPEVVPIPPTIENYIRSLHCGYNENGDPLMYCPTLDTIATALLPDVNICGKQSFSDRIINGEIAGLNEYPWMALLKFSKGIEEEFRCGGSLINNRYVVTAAHCIEDVSTEWQLSHVRLGEYDLKNTIDCDYTEGLSKCADQPLDVEIEEIIIHKDYNRSNLNDIALLRLKENVSFTEYITPVCIPMSSMLRTFNYTGQTMTVAGWGKTENSTDSNVKLRLDVSVKSNSECNVTYQHVGINIQDSHLCAGGEENKDSCTGDSGGPLVIKNTLYTENWYLMGIVSFGPKKCGARGWTGVYTRVSEFSQWIVDNIKP